MTHHSSDLASQERSRTAFLQNLPAIRSLPESEFKHITIDIPTAIETALSASAKARTLLEPFAGEAAAVDASLPDRVESLALALTHAHAMHQAATEPPSPSPDVVNSAVKLREILLADVNLSVLRGVIDSSVVTGLRGINGFRNLASDLHMLVGVFRTNRDTIAGRTTVTNDELNNAESLASSLIDSLAERERTPGVLARAIRDRQATYALFLAAYDELRAAVRYLRRGHGDADRLAPTLFARRPSSKQGSTKMSTPVGLRMIASAAGYSRGTSN